MIKCPNCAGEMEFDPSLQKVKCKYCGSVFSPDEVIDKTSTSKEEEATAYTEKSYQCSQCGATLTVFDDTAITFCSYCGSQAIIESEMVNKNNPDYVIPFKKTKEECVNNYKRLVNSFIFAPNYLKSADTLEKFRGIYIPYCLYTLDCNKTVNNEGEKYSGRVGDYILYNKYLIKADIDARYEGISFDLVSKFYDKYSHSIPFNYKEKIPYNLNYMVGFYADSRDVEDTTYETKAKIIANNDSTRFLKTKPEYSKNGCSTPKADFDVVDKKIAMFPLYFLGIRDQSNKKIHYAIVNGQTGKIAADIPVSFPKYLIGSLVLALVLFIILNSFLVLEPTIVNILSIVFAVISIVMASSQANLIAKQKDTIIDTGVKNMFKKETKPKRFKYMFLQIIAILISGLIIIFNPVEDMFYYIGALISMILIAISFKGLVDEHNELSTNELPQLEKRGGDLNA